MFDASNPSSLPFSMSDMVAWLDWHKNKGTVRSLMVGSNKYEGSGLGAGAWYAFFSGYDGGVFGGDFVHLMIVVKHESGLVAFVTQAQLAGSSVADKRIDKRLRFCRQNQEGHRKPC